MTRPARKTSTTKTTTAPAGAVKTSVTFDAESYRLIRLAMIESGLEMSELVNAMVKEKFAGWHIRKGRGAGLPGNALAAGIPTDDPSGPPGSSQEPPGPAPMTVPVPLTNRLSEIDRNAHYPLDVAIDRSA